MKPLTSLGITMHFGVFFNNMIHKKLIHTESSLTLSDMTDSQHLPMTCFVAVEAFVTR